MTNREEGIKRAMQLMDAFPPEEPAIPITGLVGEVAFAEPWFSIP
jgi:hypothetical protein